MKESLSRARKLRAASVAAVTILGMFLAPLCGTLCAASSHCSTQFGVSQSQSGDCHHTAISEDDVTPNAAFASTRNCARPELPAATLDPSRTWSQLHAARIAMTLVSTIAGKQSVISLAWHHAPGLDIGDGLLPAVPLGTATILQI